MTFAEPERLWLLAALVPVLALAWAWDRVQRQRTLTRLGAEAALLRMVASDSPGRRAVKAALVMVAVVAIVVAAARPQVRGEAIVDQRGLDLVLAMDVSKSMLVTDVAPDRLARARSLASGLLAALPGDRAAGVVFAGAAAHFPLTDDHDVTTRFLQDLGPADLPPGSNLIEALRTARCLLRPDLREDLGCRRLQGNGRGGDPLPGSRRQVAPPPKVQELEERGKVLVVFTDGGDPDEATIAEVVLAKELGIAVFVVGVGTVAGGPVFEIDDAGKRTVWKRDQGGNPVISSRNDGGLRALAEAGGDPARFLVAAELGTPDAAPIVTALTSVQRGLQRVQRREQRGVFMFFLFPALMLLLVEAALSTRRRKVEL